MALELLDVVAKIKSITPRKRGSADSSEIGLVARLELELTAADVLPYFHDSLNHFLFSEHGLRFSSAMESFNWKPAMKNMELDLAGLHFKGVDLGKFKITPFIENTPPLPAVEGDETEIVVDDPNKIRLAMNASMILNSGSDLGVLALLINDEVSLSVKPMQMGLDV
jgi:hypothetical protein